MNIQNIKNETLHKLTAREIGDLGLVNYGVGLHRGELKSRRRGLTAKKVNDYEVHFEGTAARIEFIQIVAEGETKEWAARIWRKASYPNQKEEYETYPMGIVGCEYFK